jgi:uncharacterized repeat protein (TIGR02543 family)
MNHLYQILSVLLFSSGIFSAHASAASTPGSVALTATLEDQGAGGEHWTVAWVTNATTGAYVRTLRRQQTDGGNDSHMRSHLATWASQAGLATNSNNYAPADGYSTATAFTYAAPNSPFTTTWNCKNAAGVTVPDGTYNMWIQYAEDSSAKPVTTAMTWTKGPGTTAVTTNFANQGTKFTNMKAVWTPTTYTVTFNASSGTSPSPATKLVNTDSAYGTLATTTRTGYTFAGWWTGVGGTGSEVLATTIVTASANHTLYAKWTAAATYTVTFDPQSGTTPSPLTKTVTSGSTYGILATSTRTGYTFAGWWTGPAGSGEQVITTTPVTITAAQTLYAKWTANPDPFADWASVLPANQRGADQIPQNDGVTNLMKYACNLNPLAPDVSKLTVGGSGETKGLPVQSVAGGKIRMEFLRRKAATNPGVTYSMQFSSGLGDVSWSTVNVSTTPPGTSVNAEWERVTVDDAGGGATRFGRLKVTKP